MKNILKKTSLFMALLATSSLQAQDIADDPLEDFFVACFLKVGNRSEAASLTMARNNPDFAKPQTISIGNVKAVVQLENLVTSLEEFPVVQAKLLQRGVLKASAQLQQTADIYGDLKIYS